MMMAARSASKRRGASRTAAPARRRLSLAWLRWPELSLQRLRPFVVAGLVLVLGAALVQLGRLSYPLLDRPLARVEVTSELRYLPQAEVQAALDGLLGKRFFALDLEAMHRQLRALPWVAEVNVSRRWPDRVLLKITEQQPLARWGSTGLLNLEGELFEPGQLQGFDKLPLLSGPKGSEALVMEQFHELGFLLRPLGLSINQLHLSDRNTWTLQLGKVKVAVGGGEVELRMKRFVRLYRQALKRCWPAVERIDLRYDNGVAVSQREACAA